jgi:hypothetical protein
MAKAGRLALLIIAMIANARSILLRIPNVESDLTTRAHNLAARKTNDGKAASCAS